MKNINNTLKLGVIGFSILFVAVVALIPVALKAQSVPITSTLSVGSNSSEVSRLQTFLAGDYHIYPAAIISGYFGQLTKAAVTQFQVSFGIPSIGVVGPMTRASINEILSGGLALDVTAPVIGGLSVDTNSTEAEFTLATSESTKVKVFYSTSALTSLEATGPLVKHSISGQVSEDTTFRTSHKVSLSGLNRNTVYFYKVEVTDRSGNVSVTELSTFKTAR